MIRTNHFSPRDFDNLKYIPYSFEEFKEFTEKTEDRYNRGYFSRYNTKYFSDSYCKYEISSDNETNLWTVKQSDYENDDDFYGRFIFKDEEVNNYWGSRKTVKKVIPMTIEELYERLKPCYKEIYLQNGKLFGRECYYGNEK